MLDTALVLQMRQALPLILHAVDQSDTALTRQVRAHAETVMTGRTWLQPGPPTTLGLKLAGSLVALRRHHARLLAASERALVLQFGGAVGTLSALGDAGPEVASKLAHLLNLNEPDLPWHTQRDNLVEMGEVLALLCGTLGKFAKDISLLMQAEVAEVAEPAIEGRGISSTMPQKRNPVACASVLASAARAPGLVATLLGAMPQEHERGLGLWQAEWDTLPELFKLTSVALARSVEIAEGLRVDAEKMESNLEKTLGLSQAEAVSVALAQALGREAAHQLLCAATRQAANSGQHLSSVLKAMPEVTMHLSAAEIDRLLDPREYLGSAQRFIRRVLGRLMPTADIGDVSLHFELSGHESGPAIVFANSLGADLRMWDKAVPFFERDFRIVRFDARGHGLSSIPLRPYSLQNLATDLLHLVNQLGIESFAVCGLSLGGLVGQWIAINAPDCVNALILANSAARFLSPEAWQARIDLVQSQGLAALAKTTLTRWFTQAYISHHPAEMAEIVAMIEKTSAGATSDAAKFSEILTCAACSSAFKPRAWSLAELTIQQHRLRIAIFCTQESAARSILNLTPRISLPGRSRQSSQRVCSISSIEKRSGMNDQERREAGMAVRRSVLGDAHVDRAEAAKTDFDAEFQDLITRYAWGEVWTRPGLPRPTRSLLTIAMMVALNREEELKIHLRAAANNGVSEEEIREVLLQCAIYCGVPAANSAFRAAKALFEERKGAQ